MIWRGMNGSGPRICYCWRLRAGGIRRRSVRGGCNSRRTRNYSPQRWLGRNRRRRRRWRSHNLCVLPCLRHDSPRGYNCRSSWLSDWLGNHRRSNHGLGNHGSCNYGSCNHGLGTPQLWVACLFFSLFARQNRLERVAWFGDVGEIEGCWLGLSRRLGCCAAATSSADVLTHLIGLISLDRTGVRLGFRDANRDQSVQNGSALDLQLSCKIVDSNFAHPSLFISSARLAVHISLIEVGILYCLMM